MKAQTIREFRAEMKEFKAFADKEGFAARIHLILQNDYPKCSWEYLAPQDFPNLHGKDIPINTRWCGRYLDIAEEEGVNVIL